MSATAIDNTKMTVLQRSQHNAEEIASQLGVENVKVVSAAVLEVALQEMQQNQDFEQRIKSVCARLQKSQPKPRKPPEPKRGSLHNPDLVPIMHDERHWIDLTAPIDPFMLRDLYGPDKLVIALDEYTTGYLKNAVKALKGRFPDRKLKSKATREEVISFLVQLATENP
jgi:hypothetical protein